MSVEKEIFKEDLNGVPISTDGTYIWIELSHGQIQIKFEDEGIVVDLFNASEEEVVSTYAYYSEMEK
jgi:hypothetical protein